MNEIIITPLGTISPYSKGTMNCPGFLVEYNQERILLDCGSGITRLLNFPQDLENLNVIITHYHQDHIGDIGSIQYAAYSYHNLGLLNNKIKIYLPKTDYSHSKQAIISNSLSYSEYFDIENNSSFNIKDLTVTLQDNHSHTIESFMVKLETPDLKVVYTSDIGLTNFSELIKFCQDANLIICESSFLKKHNSNNSHHLTAYDASILAASANAKSLLLTHFWPEEDKNLYLAEALKNFPNTSVAVEGKKLILRK